MPMTQVEALHDHLAPVGHADPGSPLDATWCEGPFMQVFVRAYQDSNGDGIGDLPGLVSRLDYLQALGIRGLWLMPIMPSADGDHGYATIHYREVAPCYGTLADLDELLAQAHRRGIGIILDYVVNHCAAEHPLFLSARASAASTWRDWYLWEWPRPEGWDVLGNDPWIDAGGQSYFATFGAHMPDFNLRRQEVVAFHLANLRFWLNRGVDGFRFDAAPHLVKNGPHDWKDQPESRRLVRTLCEQVKSYVNRYTVCESTSKPWIYSSTEVGGSAFAFGGFGKLILRSAAGAIDAVRELADFFVHAPPTLATMMSNHDRFVGRRLWDETGGDLVRYRLVAAAYLLLPGIPFVYYGEEVGMGAAPGQTPDNSLRAPMSWAPPGAEGGFSTAQPFRSWAENAQTQNVATETQRTGALLHFYRRLLGLRSSLAALAHGRYAESFTQGQLLGFQRRVEGQCVLVLLNFGEPSQRVVLDHLPAGTASFESLLDIEGCDPAPMPVHGKEGFEVVLPGRTPVAYLLRNGNSASWRRGGAS